jgi:hypothetical protein
MIHDKYLQGKGDELAGKLKEGDENLLKMLKLLCIKLCLPTGEDTALPQRVAALEEKVEVLLRDNQELRELINAQAPAPPAQQAQQGKKKKPKGNKKKRLKVLRKQKHNSRTEEQRALKLRKKMRQAQACKAKFTATQLTKVGDLRGEDLKKMEDKHQELVTEARNIGFGKMEEKRTESGGSLPPRGRGKWTLRQEAAQGVPQKKAEWRWDPSEMAQPPLRQPGDHSREDLKGGLGTLVQALQKQGATLTHYWIEPDFNGGLQRPDFLVRVKTAQGTHLYSADLTGSRTPKAAHIDKVKNYHLRLRLSELSQPGARSHGVTGDQAESPIPYWGTVTQRAAGNPPTKSRQTIRHTKQAPAQQEQPEDAAAIQVPQQEEAYVDDPMEVEG